MERLKGKIFDVDYGGYDGAEMHGYIRFEDGRVTSFLGRDLDGYQSEELYKLRLVLDSVVSFEIDEKRGMPIKIRIECMPNKFFLIWRILRFPIFCISVLFSIVVASFYFKDLLPYIVSLFLFIFIGNISWEAYQEVKKVFE